MPKEIMMSLEEQLIVVIRAHLRAKSPSMPIPEDTPLVDLGLDSLGAIDLLFSIEERFGITFPDGSLNERTFKTRGSLQSVVQTLLSAQAFTAAGATQQ